MDKFKIYMDNCCYGRPFDDQTQIKVRLEATAKMYIQSLVRFRSLVLYSSFMLSHEVDKCPVKETREYIAQFIKEFSSFHVSKNKDNEVTPLSNEIMETGIKYKDAIHLACSIIAGCDYMITTDKRVLKYKTDKIKIVNPIEFVKIWEESHD